MRYLKGTLSVIAKLWHEQHGIRKTATILFEQPRRRHLYHRHGAGNVKVSFLAAQEYGGETFGREEAQRPLRHSFTKFT